MMTQKEKVLKYMLAGEKINRDIAMKWGIFDLPGRIRNLRDDDGWIIGHIERGKSKWFDYYIDKSKNAHKLQPKQFKLFDSSKYGLHFA